jgi:glycosyltransferase involved in cell wall biosynthesis
VWGVTGRIQNREELMASAAARKTVCFFCKTDEPSLLDRIDFYAQDLRILRDLGFDVHIATRPRDLIRADLYFVWWWTWAFIPVALARSLRRPVIVTGTFDLWMFDSRPRIQRSLHRFALRYASANVFISELERSTVSAAFDTRNPVYIPLGVDTEKLKPASLERGPFMLTIAGSGMDQGNSARKCIAEIIRAAPLIHSEHPDVRFVIVGKKGSDFPSLQALVQQLGAESFVEFPGTVSEVEKIELLQRCRVYLQPSRHEGFGLSVLEAMSCGAPVVTSAVGALPEVGGEAVHYAPDPSPETIARTTSSLLSSSDDRRRLSALARERAERLFRSDRRRAELESLIASLLTLPPSPARLAAAASASPTAAPKPR